MAKYDIFDIANWFLTKENMAHKKLQKICYYAVAWGYALLKRPICANDEFQAWEHGPVSLLLYDKYKGNAWVELQPDCDYATLFDNVTEDLLESIWLTYGEQTGNALEALTHSELPWIKARGSSGAVDKCTAPIDIKDMEDFYMSIYTGGDA